MALSDSRPDYSGKIFSVLKYVILLLLAGTLLWFSFREVEWNSFVNGFRSADFRDRLYFEMYKRRFDTLGISMQPGYHAGAYSYSEAAVPELSPEVRTMQEMLSAIDTEFNTSYQLGDTFTIAAQGPAYKFMKEGKISTPSVFPPNFTSLLATYKLAAEAFK